VRWEILVDPQVKPGDGSFQNFERLEGGAESMHRIKERSSASVSPQSPAPVATSDPGSLPLGKERRRSPRFRCSGSAEFRVEGSDVRMWGTLSDVSLHGCYVEMTNTFPANTRLSLRLEAMGIRAQMLAVVRVSYPFLGMGLCFLKIEPGQLVQLKRLLAAVTTPASVSDPNLVPTSTASSAHSLADVDAKAMLDGLSEFFRGNSLLSREDFYEIARRMRR
jgi:hypothetical protein